MLGKIFNVALDAKPTGLSTSSAGGGSTDAPQASQVGVINSGQGFVTFACAPALVAGIWKTLGIVEPAWAQEKWIPLVLALVVGMLIYAASETGGGLGKQRILGFAFALLNSVSIAGTALGLDAATSGVPEPAAESQPANNGAAPNTDEAPAPTTPQPAPGT